MRRLRTQRKVYRRDRWYAAPGDCRGLTSAGLPIDPIEIRRQRAQGSTPASSGWVFARLRVRARPRSSGRDARPEEFLVGSEQEHLVSGLEAGVAPRRMLKPLGALGSPKGDDPCPGGKVPHGQSLQSSTGSDHKSTDDERLLVDVEGLDDVEAE